MLITILLPGFRTNGFLAAVAAKVPVMGRFAIGGLEVAGGVGAGVKDWLAYIARAVKTLIILVVPVLLAGVVT